MCYVVDNDMYRLKDEEGEEERDSGCELSARREGKDGHEREREERRRRRRSRKGRR